MKSKTTPIAAEPEPSPTAGKTLRYRGATLTLATAGNRPSPTAGQILRYRGATTAPPAPVEAAKPTKTAAPPAPAQDAELTGLLANLSQAEEQSDGRMSLARDPQAVSHRVGLTLVAKQLMAVADRLKKSTEVLDEMQAALYKAVPPDCPTPESTNTSRADQELETVIAQEERKTVAAVLSSVCAQADDLVELAEHLPSFSKEQDDTHALVDINTCIDEVVESSQAETKGLVVKALAPIPEVFAAKEEISLILSNVVENSVWAVEERSRDGRVIRIETGQKGGAVLVTVTDNGVGIEPKNRKKVFSPFYTSRAGALGMGLTSAQYLVQKYRGTITINSLPDQGTMVRISLPIGVGSELG